MIRDERYCILEMLVLLSFEDKIRVMMLCIVL